MAEDSKTDVFQFMSLRSPQNVEPKKLRHFYIQDEYISQEYFSQTDETNTHEKPTRKLREIFSYNSPSAVGKILYKKIFCESSGKSIQQINDEIVEAVLELTE
jgi:hypothetical protein